MYEIDLPTKQPGPGGVRKLVKELKSYGIRRVIPCGPRGGSGRVERIRFPLDRDAVMAKLLYPEAPVFRVSLP